MKRGIAFPHLLLAASVIADVTLLAVNRDRLNVTVIEQLTRDLGVLAPLGHVLLFAAGTVLFAPGAIVGLVGGALFGPWWGTLLNLIGATLGATAAFIVARYIGTDWVRSMTGSRIKRLISSVEVEGWRFVTLMRLVPLVQFNLLNYALGLTRTALLQYIFASVLAMAPGTLAYTWLGYAGRQSFGGETAAARYGLLALGLLAAVAFVPRLVGRLDSDAAHRWIGASALVRLRADKGTIAVIDIRSPTDFNGPLGHIAGVGNQPLAEVQMRLSEIASLKRSWWSSSVARTRCRATPPVNSRPPGSRPCAWCVAAWSSGTNWLCRSVTREPQLQGGAAR